MISQTALTELREHFKKRIGHAEYTVNSMVETARIESASILADGRVAISFIIGPALDAGETVTEVRLYDVDGEIFASKSVNIARGMGNAGIYFLYYFRIEEA